MTSDNKKKDPAAPEVEVEGKSMVEILEQISLFAGLGREHLERVADDRPALVRVS